MMAELPVERIDLQPPPLQELVDSIKDELARNFKSTSVSVKKCPNLRQAPYNLAFEGLCGYPALLMWEVNQT